jgi:hypothetical protein
MPEKKDQGTTRTKRRSIRRNYGKVAMNNEGKIERGERRMRGRHKRE